MSTRAILKTMSDRIEKLESELATVREECAKACDEVAIKHDNYARKASTHDARIKHIDIAYGASTCAAAIRAMRAGEVIR